VDFFLPDIMGCLLYNLMPLVSVIIPTRNRASLLPRAIQSVISQTFGDYECIVVDDASNDGTEKLEILSSVGRPVRYVKLPVHGGVSRARNAGVERASGQWLAFLDSDDEWLPQKLEKQVHWHQRKPSFKISQTKEIWVRHGKRVNPPQTHEKKEGYIFEESLKRCMVTPSSVMLEKKLFHEAGRFNETLPACEDYDLWLRITYCFPVGLVDEYLLTRFGGHADQLSATIMGLDRFRIKSIIGLLRSNRLSPEQLIIAKDELLKKTIIVANGYKKRGNTNEYDRYMRIFADFSVGA
jgi:glycosyltransferase involved in cell wall biosynthesis